MCTTKIISISKAKTELSPIFIKRLPFDNYQCSVSKQLLIAKNLVEYSEVRLTLLNLIDKFDSLVGAFVCWVGTVDNFIAGASTADVI